MRLRTMHRSERSANSICTLLAIIFANVLARLLCIHLIQVVGGPHIFHSTVCLHRRSDIHGLRAEDMAEHPYAPAPRMSMVATWFSFFPGLQVCKYSGIDGNTVSRRHYRDPRDSVVEVILKHFGTPSNFRRDQNKAGARRRGCKGRASGCLDMVLAR